MRDLQKALAGSIICPALLKVGCLLKSKRRLILTRIVFATVMLRELLRSVSAVLVLLSVSPSASNKRLILKHMIGVLYGSKAWARLLSGPC